MTLAAPSVIRKLDSTTLYATESFTDPADAAQNSTILPAEGLNHITFTLFNDTDQSVTFQLKSSDTVAFTIDPDVGSPVVLAAGAKTIETLTDPHLYLRWNINPAANSVGTVTIVAVAR